MLLKELLVNLRLRRIQLLKQLQQKKKGSKQYLEIFNQENLG